MRDRQRHRLDLGDRGGRVSSGGFDDRKSTRDAEPVQQIGRRGLGDDDHWTQKRHM